MVEPFLRVLGRELKESGVKSAGLVVLLAALSGGAFVLSFEALLPTGVANGLEILALLVVQVLGVIFTLLVLAARSMAALSTDLSVLRVTGQWSIQSSPGTDPRPDWTLPRLLAVAVSAGILYLYFVVAALLVGSLVSNQTPDVREMVQLFEWVSPAAMLLGWLRTSLLAAAGVLAVVRHSWRRARSLPGLPSVISGSVLRAILLMLGLELFYQVLARSFGFGLGQVMR